jgi:acetyltransferase-like isoleucine patch superfamily enzyme
VKVFFRFLIVLLPWWVKRRVLGTVFGYRLHPSARIGLAWIYPEQLVMHENSHIDHLTMCKGLKLLELRHHASIGRLNWITAYPRDGSAHFAHLTARHPALLMGEHAAITNRHIVDCTEQISIGPFATIAGFRSQLLTHSIDLGACRQDAKPIVIGAHTFIGTGCILLGGAILPDHSVVGAASLLRTAYTKTHRLYAGVPAREIADLDPRMGYFARTSGFVT